MAYDEGLAQLLRDDLAEYDGVTEKKMFGGLCFLLNGNMMCGVHNKNGTMFRIGKENETKARGIEGASDMSFTGRPMRGFIEVSDEAMSDDSRRKCWLDMAISYTQSLPMK